MKKQKPKKWGSRQQREEWRQEMNAFGLKKRHTNIPKEQTIEYVWPRIRARRNKHYVNAKLFFEAGYFAVDYQGEGWITTHNWCKENIGVYTWTGNIFWFQSETDRQKFLKQFTESIRLN